MLIARRPFRAALLAAALVGSPAGAQQSPLAGLDDYVATALRELDNPGVAIAIVSHDSVVYAKGFGVRRLGDSAPVDAHTIFAIGSSSKAFTGLGVAMMVDQGKMAWDAPLITYLPDFELFDPWVTREFTLRDALTHRSGIARTDLVWISGQFDSQELLRRLRFVKPSSSLRTQFGYQNLMFLAAGTALVKASGASSWGDFVERRIFEPLGMRESSTSVRALAGLTNLAQPHGRIDDTLRVIPFRNVDIVAPAGAINSNVLDMSQWLRFQLAGGKVDGKPLLGERAFEETHTPQFLIGRGAAPRSSRESHFSAYGLGWFLEDYRGHFVVHHGGNIDGMTAFVAMMPDDSVGVVVLANLNGSPLPSALGFSVFDRYLGGPSTDRIAALAKSREEGATRAAAALARLEAARVQGTSPSLALDRYAGAYADSANGTMTVAVENGTLVLRYGSQFTGDLTHWNYDTFRVHWRSLALLGGTFATFALDRKGEVGSLTVEQFGEFGREAKPASAGGR